MVASLTVTTNLDTNGQFTVTLLTGNYEVSLGKAPSDRFYIAVPDAATTNDIVTLMTNSVAVPAAPFILKSSGIGTNLAIYGTLTLNGESVAGGGPTNGVTALTATNIAEYFATNAALRASNTLHAAKQATNAVLAFLAGNGDKTNVLKGSATVSLTTNSGVVTITSTATGNADMTEVTNTVENYLGITGTTNYNTNTLIVTDTESAVSGTYTWVADAWYLETTAYITNNGTYAELWFIGLDAVYTNTTGLPWTGTWLPCTELLNGTVTVSRQPEVAFGFAQFPTNTLYVAPWGNNATARRGRPDYAWASPSNAVALAGNNERVVILGGSYTNSYPTNWYQTGEAEILVKGKTNFVLEGVGRPMIFEPRMGTCPLVVQQCSNVIVRGLHIQGVTVGTNFNANPGGLFVFGHLTYVDCEALTIEDNLLTSGMDHGILEVGNGERVTRPSTNQIIIRNNVIRGFGLWNAGWEASPWWDGAGIVSGAAHIHGNWIESCADGIELFPYTHASRSKVENNVVKNVVFYGISQSPYMQHGVIQNNLIYNESTLHHHSTTNYFNRSSGILIPGSGNNIIQNNTIAGFTYGIYFEESIVSGSSPNNNLIQGNTIRHCTNNAIAFRQGLAYPQATNLVVLGNTISHIGGEAISVIRFRDSIFDNNYISDAGLYTAEGNRWGIRLLGCTNATVRFNTILDTGPGLYDGGIKLDDAPEFGGPSTNGATLRGNLFVGGISPEIQGAVPIKDYATSSSTSLARDEQLTFDDGFYMMNDGGGHIAIHGGNLHVYEGFWLTNGDYTTPGTVLTNNGEGYAGWGSPFVAWAPADYEAVTNAAKSAVTIAPGSNVTITTNTTDANTTYTIAASIVGGTASMDDVTNAVTSWGLTNDGALFVLTNYANTKQQGSAVLTNLAGTGALTNAGAFQPASTALTNLDSLTPSAGSLLVSTQLGVWTVKSGSAGLLECSGSMPYFSYTNIWGAITNIAKERQQGSAYLTNWADFSTNVVNAKQAGSFVLTNLAAAGITNWIAGGIITATTNNGVVTFSASSAAGPAIVTNSIYVPAGAMGPAGGSTADGGRTSASAGSWTNGLSIMDAWDFDSATNECAKFQWAPGPAFAGQVSAVFYYASTNTAMDGSSNVVWGLAATPLEVNSSPGAWVYMTNVTATLTSSNTIQVATLPIITMTNYTGNALFSFRASRLGTNTADVLVGDARLLGIRIGYTATNFMGGF